MNLDSFLNSMKERNSKRLDLIAPTNLLTLDYSTYQGSYVLGANMNNDSKEFKVNHNTIRQICDKMGLPAKYWDYLEKQGYEVQDYSGPYPFLPRPKPCSGYSHK